MNLQQDRARASLELLLNISRELTATLDLYTLLGRVLDLATKHLNAERASLIALDPEGHPLEAAIITDGRLHSHTLEQLEVTLTHGLAGWVRKNRQPALLDDTSKDKRWLRRADDSNERTGPKSAICVPLVAQEDLVGILTIVHPQPHFFRTDDQSLLMAIADISAMAVRNAQLFQSAAAARQRYQDLFEDSIDPIVLTDLQGVVQEANRRMAEFAALPPEALIGMKIGELHDIDWKQVGPDFSRLLDGEGVMYESRFRPASGPVRAVQVYVHRVTDGQDGIVQWLVRDISERKELDALREDLSDMIYHDLRSPLANIISSLDILKTMLPASEGETMELLRQIAVRSTERMQRMISQLLDISRMESGQSLIEPRPVDPHALVVEAVQVVMPIVEGKNQTLAIELPAELPVVRVDVGIITRVLINLLENANKFTPLGGDLSICAAAVDESLEIRVSDSGRGIPEEAHEMIFEKFNRLKGENMPKGFGLGLSFCKLAVEAHGGKIWVENRQPSGSRFILRLPIDKH